jgi:uncharacterized protein (DUF2336 family)
MFGPLKSLFRRRPRIRQKRDPVRYEQEKQIARSTDTRARINLAGDSRTHQEILYYLATHDPDPAVRRAVATNVATPVQAAAALASDKNADVRLLLAGRLVSLLPELSQDKQTQLYAYCVQALGTLALDEVLKIRKALSTALQDHAHTPPKVAGQLARDVEREVSEPILRYCAALSDEDLLDILKGHPASWAVQAIAGRKTVSAKVSRAVIRTKDRPAGVLLLTNKGAEVTKDLLTEIVASAHRFPEWQKPMALHRNLPAEVARELASYADASVRDILMKREDFDEKTVEGIAAVFSRRLAFADAEARTDESPAQRVKRLAKKKMLTEDIVSDALAMRDRDFVFAALAHMAQSDAKNIERIFAMKAPKPIVALCWRTGLSMRLALRMQQDLGQVPAPELLYPRGGLDYPLTEADMIWQLEFLGLKAA